VEHDPSTTAHEEMFEGIYRRPDRRFGEARHTRALTYVQQPAGVARHVRKGRKGGCAWDRLRNVATDMACPAHHHREKMKSNSTKTTAADLQKCFDAGDDVKSDDLAMQVTSGRRQSLVCSLSTLIPQLSTTL
jgi:hypothetical protein